MRTAAASDVTGGQSRLSRYALAAFALLAGVLYLVAHTIGGSLEDGLSTSFAFVAGAAAIVYRARRDRMRGRDERLAMIDKRAMAIGALVAFAVAWGAWLVEIAKGNEGSAYVWIVVVGIVAWMLAELVLSHRS
jgi:hypothetical protein